MVCYLFVPSLPHGWRQEWMITRASLYVYQSVYRHRKMYVSVCLCLFVFFLPVCTFDQCLYSSCCRVCLSRGRGNWTDCKDFVTVAAYTQTPTHPWEQLGL